MRYLLALENLSTTRDYKSIPVSALNSVRANMEKRLVLKNFGILLFREARKHSSAIGHWGISQNKAAY